ncbi:restriction endonuclease subunit S [Anabaena cylindrica FACHB-243]|uniref:Restriction modification system DNA specificity domain protein n=1 Tax=Anabaena cylindrica (strain ATCC 27899 / PCC 7122) TaxID=272123 RepID=K9ZAH0_ANACC|nr:MULTISPECIES: restriction endonuclease subunit S [Anabaena]AFZ56176.1 restriction modification system DNA specificity domain protein [Anabaena cylindrica PCC 7122]MBD2417404.1 restriction endonuclease subunit S [Anabaena cylindrica FACHB-243]MBY5285263.1 hypothetical protein [Anabaena sp. CCAP 1446/1C]MBY5306274.1 hypothetical protein [Anabaena sp. CCAP 1446/1C]MCM2409695.1 restriction endonuclease subunit S [Anabaena sp. CCAP 1446/1C]
MSDDLLDLPEGWELTTLEDLCINPKNDIVDGPFGSNLKASEYIDSGIPIIRLQNIDRNIFIDKNIKFVSVEKGQELERHTFKKGDIIITKLGDPLGKACLVPDHLSNGIIVADVVRARINEKFALKKYLIYLLNSQIIIVQLQTDTKGTTRPRVNLNHIRQLKIPLPPLNEQKRIVAKIEELSDRSQKAQQALEAIPQLCDRFRQSVLAAAFRGDLTADWREKNPDVEPASVLLERIKNKRFELAETAREISTVKKVYDEEAQFSSQQKYSYLPETWISCTINSIGNVCNGSTPSRNVEEYWKGSIPWVSSGEVVNNIIYETREKITELGYKNTSVRILPKGTVLLAMIGQGKTRGQTSILEIKATINQNIAAIILNHGLVVSEYLWYWFQYQYAATRELGSGSGPQALNCQRVREIPLILAPINEQIEVVNSIKYILHKVEVITENYQQATKKLEKLNQSILSKAFRGELVPQDPEDEPASILLEKIRAEREKLHNSKPKSTSKRKTKTPKGQGTIPGLE